MTTGNSDLKATDDLDKNTAHVAKDESLTKMIQEKMDGEE